MIAEATLAGPAGRERRRREHEGWLAEQARQLAEREAATVRDAERAAERRVEVLAALRALLRERRWSVHPSVVAEAIELAGLDALDDGQALRAGVLVGRADATVARALGKAESEAADEADLVRARDAKVRRVALKAVRAISADDEDWATEDNGMGWSKTTTVLGHALSAKVRLSPELAAHAIGLLRVHRRQVDEHLHVTLFGE